MARKSPFWFDKEAADKAVGLCQCGCGLPTTKYPRTRIERGYVKGQQRPFVSGHHMRQAHLREGASKWLCKPGESNSQWKGGRPMHSQGYQRIFVPDHPYADNGYVLEHRLVVEQSLGRYLQPDEHVHHIDENKLNNSIENLRVMGVSEHLLLHRWGRRG